MLPAGSSVWLIKWVDSVLFVRHRQAGLLKPHGSCTCRLNENRRQAMGCDIHFYVERKDDDKWVTADKWMPDPYADEGEEPRLIVDHDDCFYGERNYDLFAMLAD